MNMKLSCSESAIAAMLVACVVLAAGCDSSPGPLPPQPTAAKAIPLAADAQYDSVQASYNSDEAEAGSKTGAGQKVTDKRVTDKRVTDKRVADKRVADKKDAAAAEKPTTDSSDVKKPFDPVEINGKYFVGWEKPKFALVISGRQDGYLEPCGCAGLENQKGGLSRRHAFIRDLGKRGWPVTAVDVGGLVRRFGKQAEIQFDISAQALKQMGYSGVGLGPADLRLSAGDTAVAISEADTKDCIFVSANVNVLDQTPTYRIVEIGGMKLGITSVLGESFAQQVNNSEIVVTPAVAALKKVVPKLKSCDVRILLAQATIEESKKLAAAFPEFTLVVTGDSVGDPPAQPEVIKGTKSRLIEVGPKGEFVIVAGFYDDPKRPIRFQRVALDSRFPNTDEMKQLMVTYQDQLQQLGWDGLGLRRVAAPQAQSGGKLAGQFVGGQKCKECHEAAWDVWANSKHAHATDTLVKLDPPRQFDAECISCHATGWNAQEHFPYLTGFDSVDKTPLLVSNSCENCHGPGGAHVAAEKAGTNSPRAVAAREALKLTWPQAASDTCIKCHDGDNSPEFSKDIEKYWSEIAH